VQEGFLKNIGVVCPVVHRNFSSVEVTPHKIDENIPKNDVKIGVPREVAGEGKTPDPSEKGYVES
jgi:hypothetical protein